DCGGQNQAAPCITCRNSPMKRAMKRPHALSAWMVGILAVFALSAAWAADAQDPGGAEPPPGRQVKPLRVLLVTGGCCHDYRRQKDVLKKGLEARARVEVDHIHSDSDRTDVRFEQYAKAN